METKAKKTEISILNMILCFLVILIHCMGSSISQTESNALSYTLFITLFKLSSFAVQGFIFLSAAKLFMKKTQPSYSKFIFRRIKTVLVPYIIWVLIYYLFKLKIERQSFDILVFLKSIFLGNMHAHFYFVVIIMQFYFLFPLFRRIYSKGNEIVITALSVLISLAFQFSFSAILKSLTGFEFVYTDRTFLTYAGYWTLGAFAGINYDKFKKDILNSKLLTVICFLIFAAATAFVNCRTVKFSEYIPGFGELFFAYTFFAIAAFFILSVSLGRLKFFESKFFNLLNGVSYRVYLIHPLVLIFFDSYAPKLSASGPFILSVIRYLFVTFVSFAFSLLIELIIKRIKKRHN